jgi:CDP-2,3-bis-(O-geranylgeranyl)-sn-glycerol synthase
MLPAYVANAMPVLSAHFKLLPSLNFPVDRGKTLNNKRLFGKSKTVRGFIVGIGGAIIVSLLQYLLYKNNLFSEYSLIEYTFTNSLIMGFLLGAGALTGDLIKSFIKRRIGIKSGKPWIIADQTDYVLGAHLFAAISFLPSPNHVIVIIIISPFLALLANIISFITGMKKVWW